MINTQLHKLFAFIKAQCETDFEPIADDYHTWWDRILEQERAVREEIRQYTIRPFYLKGHIEYLLEMKCLLDQHPSIQQFDRRTQYALGHLSLHATDSTKRFEQVELAEQKQLLALMKKTRKRGVTDRVLSQLSKTELYLLKQTLATGLLVSLRSIVTYAYEDLLVMNSAEEPDGLALPFNRPSLKSKRG